MSKSGRKRGAIANGASEWLNKLGWGGAYSPTGQVFCEEDFPEYRKHRNIVMQFAVKAVALWNIFNPIFRHCTHFLFAPIALRCIGNSLMEYGNETE